MHELNERFKGIVDVLYGVIWSEVGWHFSESLGGVDKKSINVFFFFDAVGILEAPGSKFDTVLRFRFWRSKLLVNIASLRYAKRTPGANCRFPCAATCCPMLMAFPTGTLDMTLYPSLMIYFLTFFTYRSCPLVHLISVLMPSSSRFFANMTCGCRAARIGCEPLTS